MKRRSREWALLAAAAALLAAIALTFRRIPHPRRSSAPEKVTVAPPTDAGQPTAVVSGFDFEETSSGKPLFRLHADRTVGFAAGAGMPSTWYGLERVTLTLYPDQGPSLTVRSDRADYDPRTSAMHLIGHVTIQDGQGTVVRTSRVDFDPRRRTFDAPASVAFEKGGMNGGAASASYDLAGRTMNFAGPVRVEGSGADRAPFSRLTADAASYRRDDSVLEFTGRIRGERGPDVVACERLAVHLDADNRVDGAMAAGGVRGRGGLESYEAEQARLVFSPPGSLSRIELQGAPATLSTKDSRGIPGTVQARRIDLTLAAGVLQRADASGAVRVERRDPADRGPRVVTSESASADYGPGGAVSEVSFHGDVHADAPEGVASAPDAVYDTAGNRTVLSGNGERDAELASPRGRIVARSIAIEGRPAVITAQVAARVFLSPESKASAGLPGYLRSSRSPTRGRANTVILDDGRKTARLWGDAALWQEDNALFADEIVLNDSTRVAVASGNVRVVGRTRAEDAAGSSRVSIASEGMVYQDAKSTATFEGGVVARRGPSRAAGQSGEAAFDENHRVSRTTLEGDVTFEDPPTGRSGRGDRVVDDLRKGETVLTGDPAVARDGAGNRVTGSILTFEKASGTVRVQSGKDKKVETIYQTHGH